MAAIRNKTPARALPSACLDIARLYSLSRARFVRPSNGPERRSLGQAFRQSLLGGPSELTSETLIIQDSAVARNHLQACGLALRKVKKIRSALPDSATTARTCPKCGERFRPNG